MGALTTVGVNNNFTTGQATITHRSTNHKTTGRIDKVLGVFIEKTGRNHLAHNFFDD